MRKLELTFIGLHLLLGALCACLFIGEAQAAGPARLSWTTPTQYTDGKPLARSAIAKYEIEYIQQTPYAPKRGYKTAKANTNAYLLTLPIPGVYLFRIRVYDTGGMSSGWSAEIIAMIP